MWGEVAVVHFDAHLDSWNPKQWGGGINKYDELTHGTLLHFAHEEGLLKNNTGVHVGTRALLFDKTEDLRHDAECGFESIMATEIDHIGVDGIVERIVRRVGKNRVYVTIDIDVLDAGEFSGVESHWMDPLTHRFSFRSSHWVYGNRGLEHQRVGCGASNPKPCRC